MGGRNGEITAPATLEKQGPAERHENRPFNAVDLLVPGAQAQSRSVEQANQKYVDNKTLPSLQIDEKPYLDGYTYTKAEAQKHANELNRDENWSNNDIEFLKAFEKQRKNEENQSLDADLRKQGISSATEKKSTEKTEPLTGKVDGNKFELGAEAEKIAWEGWLLKLNTHIQQNLDKAAKMNSLPTGLSGDVHYRINSDGSTSFTDHATEKRFEKIVHWAVNETFHHPELLKWPAGAHKPYVERDASFSIGKQSGMHTGPIEPEYVVK